MNEITIAGKTYISSKRAAEITGYAKDYVGQLCREGHVDARMVGRSWYVYEPSIQAHRFGSEEKNAVHTDIIPVHKESTELKVEWKPSTYKAELPQQLPEIIDIAQKPSVNVLERPEYAPESEIPAKDSLSDMQSAWKEWFSKKQEAEMARIESPEIIEEREDEYVASTQVQTHAVDIDEKEVSVAITRPQEDEVEDTRESKGEVVTIKRNFKPKNDFADEMPEKEGASSAFNELLSHERATERNSSNLVLQASMVAISLIVISIALIGSGLGETIIPAQAKNNPAIKYLVGSRSYTNINI